LYAAYISLHLQAIGIKSCVFSTTRVEYPRDLGILSTCEQTLVS